MSDDEMVTRVGHVTQTTPPSTPLDTLKALVLRTVDRLDYVADRLSDADCGVADDVFEFIDGIKSMQFEAIAEHVPVARDERLGELRYIHPDGLTYTDGSPVLERWNADYGTTDYYTRYDGPREEALQRFQEWSREALARVQEDEHFNNIVRGVDWGRHGPTQDL